MSKNRFLLATTALLSLVAIECSFPVIFCIAVANRPYNANWRYGPEVSIANRDEKQHPICVRDVTNDKDLGHFPREADLRYAWFFAVSPDNRTLASANGWVKLWDLSSGENLPFDDSDLDEGSSDYAHFLAFSSDGRTLAATNDKWIALWDARTGKHIISFARSWVTAQIILLWMVVTLSFFAIGMGIKMLLSRIRQPAPVRHPEPLPTAG